MASNVEKGVKKTGENFLRIAAVLLGVLGACWLFSNGWRMVFDYVADYRLSKNFFAYFINPECLFPVAALFTALLFLIVSLRDLAPIAKGFSLATAIICAVAFVVYLIYFAQSVTGFSDLIQPSFLMPVGKTVMLLAYFLFAMYCRNGGSVKNVAWIIGLVAIFMILGAKIYGFIVQATQIRELVDQMLVLLAHAAMFFCGLKQY